MGKGRSGKRMSGLSDLKRSVVSLKYHVKIADDQDEARLDEEGVGGHGAPGGDHSPNGTPNKAEGELH